MKIKLYERLKLDFRDKDWYEITKINYSYRGRKVFLNSKNNQAIHNPHFPYEELNKNLITCLNAWYLYAFVEDEDEAIDTDFDIGFNNIEGKYEHKIIFDYLGYGKDIYCIVAHLKGKRNAEDYPLFNKKSSNFIEKKYNIVYKGKSEVPDYIVKLNDCSEVNELNDFIAGYCISPIININDLCNLAYDRFTPVEDIKNIKILTEIFEKVIVRAQIYANHNLVIYSPIDISADITSKLLDYSKHMGIKLEKIRTV